MTMQVEYPLYTRDERQAQMLAALRGVGVPIPATALFRLVGLARTPYALDALAELVAEGLVSVDHDRLTNGLPCRVYGLTEHGQALTAPPHGNEHITEGKTGNA